MKQKKRMKCSMGLLGCALFVLLIAGLNGCGKKSSSDATFTLKSSNSAS